MSTLLFYLLLIKPADLPQSHTKESHKTSYRLLRRKEFWKIALFSSVFSLGFIIANFFYVIKISTLKIDEVNMAWIILLYSFVQLITPRILRKLNKEQTEHQIIYSTFWFLFFDDLLY